MPNWTYNSLTIEGSKEDISAIKQQLNKPFQRQHDTWNKDTNKMELVNVTYTNPIFAFWNIVKPTDLETYNLQKDPKHDDTIIDFKGDNWYDWNVRNWGTKWDVSVHDGEEYPDTEIMIDTEDTLAYRFNTAWSPPLPAIEALSEMFPDVEIDLEFEEETGWGGNYIFSNGQGTEIQSYDWKCRECDNIEDETPYCETCEFDMCPKCGYGEPMDEDRAQCEIHKEQVNA